jgi:prepilin-type N-terminal cleavage/methylation domain-containing protein
MNTPKARGFTLIELLVVVAIIGLIATIVLAAVGTVRNKGLDTYVKGQLAQLRSGAELYRQNNSNSYAGYCSSAATDLALKALAANDPNAGTNNVQENTFSVNGLTGVAGNKVNCIDDTSVFIIDAPLSSGVTARWCIDSIGKSTAETVVPSSTACQ